MQPGDDYQNPFQDPNPYESPEQQQYYDPQQPTHAAQYQMEYLRAYGFLFDHPNWVTNLLLGTVAQIIPVVGPLVFNGYACELIESLHRYPDHQYPDFDFNRFGDYLVRGLWPFLVGLVASLIVLPVALVMPMLLPLVAVIDNGPLVAIAFVIWFLMYLASFVVMGFVIVPMVLRSALMQGFTEAFSWTFISDFVSRMWVDMVLACLVHMFMSMIITTVGLMLFCVGIYPAMVVAMFAQWHLMYQLYEVYLSRGGHPIPLKEPEAGY